MNAGYGDAIARVSAEIAASVAAHRNVRAGLLDGPGDVVKGKEPRNGPTNTNTWGTAMAEHIHENHSHRHGPNCGHTAIVHDGHTDYLHDGHLHHPNGSGVEEHRIGVSGANAAGARRRIPALGTTRRTGMAPAADTMLCRTEITSTTWCPGICTTRTPATATITARLCKPEGVPATHSTTVRHIRVVSVVT